MSTSAAFAVFSIAAFLGSLLLFTNTEPGSSGRVGAWIVFFLACTWAGLAFGYFAFQHLKFNPPVRSANPSAPLLETRPRSFTTDPTFLMGGKRPV